jgi:hypothetical protein
MGVSCCVRLCWIWWLPVSAAVAGALFVGSTIDDGTRRFTRENDGFPSSRPACHARKGKPDGKLIPSNCTEAINFADEFRARFDKALTAAVGGRFLVNREGMKDRRRLISVSLSCQKKLRLTKSPPGCCGRAYQKEAGIMNASQRNFRG